MANTNKQFSSPSGALNHPLWLGDASKTGARRSPRGAKPLLSGIFSRSRTHIVPRATVAIVADAVAYLSDHPWSAPTLSVWQASSGATYVQCNMVSRTVLLTADEARQVATVLFDDQPFAGAAGLAAELFNLSDTADPQPATAVLQ